MSKMTLREALYSLDPEQDSDWTSDGAPRLERLTELLGETVKRGRITDAFPSFTRENLRAEKLAPEQEAPAPEEEHPEPPEPAEDADEGGWPAELRALEQRVQEAQRKRDEADDELHAANLELQRRVEEYDRTKPRNSNQMEIMSAIRRSMETRGARIKELQEMSLRRAAMSPIDRAMAPRRSRGNQRPAYPKS